ncbi:hypothetical protein, partial [Streptomyces sp. 150FB]|uniref:hypothetical protein n=1 Tax=Streptomyces sp. 150FB TaxID=1576605 RepID=UPI001F1AF7D9
MAPDTAEFQSGLPAAICGRQPTRRGRRALSSRRDAVNLDGASVAELDGDCLKARQAETARQ